jgi:Ca-activated chloride channel family protein
VLAIDVSGSVDPTEYEIQRRGLAEALLDAEVAQALVRSEAAVTLVQWTGTGRQDVSVPWRRLMSMDDVQAFATEVAGVARRWRIYSTAIGEVLAFSVALFDAAPACKRRVIDVSGDGPSNEGDPPRDIHAKVRSAGVTVNALAIEASESGLTTYFRDHVIVGPGAFVATAASFEDYPARIRQKLLREIRAPLACALPRCFDPLDEG